MKTTDEVLKERGEFYGNFSDGAALEANILSLLAQNHLKQRGRQFSELERIFFSKIIMKLSRLSVTPNHVDSWTDIAGYARLIEQHYNGVTNGQQREQYEPKHLTACAGEIRGGVVQGLSDSSKIESSKYEVSPQRQASMGQQEKWDVREFR